MSHVPVLVDELVELMKWEFEDAVFADFTFGGGGHTAALLEASPKPSRIILLDQDETCVERARQAYPLAELFHENFSRFPELVSEPVDRILVDLGVSSFQLDEAERGFSFQKEGPLDMRMDPSRRRPAWEILEEISEKDFVYILRTLGEERRAPIYARRLIHERKKAPIRSTKDFVEALGHRMDSRTPQGRHPLTKVFQAVRMHINNEMGVLQNLLDFIPSAVSDRGRLAIITFHSLEDRAVKWGLKNRMKPVNKKVIQAGQEERRQNPRSRTAKLRVYEKLSK